MRLLDRITTDPEICHGKPVIRGLRYPVEVILELLSSGMTPQEILDDYEDLELGRGNPQMMFMMGKIKVTNLGEVMKFITYFNRIAS